MEGSISERWQEFVQSKPHAELPKIRVVKEKNSLMGIKYPLNKKKS